VLKSQLRISLVEMRISFLCLDSDSASASASASIGLGFVQVRITKSSSELDSMEENKYYNSIT